jgi:DNA-directed RNA polymerase subunit F
MTQDEIIEMARQAGVRDDEITFEFSQYKYLDRFAKLVAEKEREACAKIVEENANRCGVDTVAWMLLASNAQAIRARGQA